MTAWVIEPFLTEQYVKILDKENMMPDFVMCSKSVIVDYIIDYLDKPDANEEIKGILSKYYKNKIDLVRVQQDEVVIGNIDKIYEYNYSSVHAGLTIGELNDMKEVILSVHNEEQNIPYINTIPGDIIAGIINNLLALYRVNGDIAYKRMAHLLTKNKELFKDKPNATAKGTIFKAVNKRSEDLKIILRGIEFLIDQKTKGNQTESWRVY